MLGRRTILLYGAAAVAAFELAVFATAFLPDVSPAYRAYYIARSTDCWTQDDGDAYSFGQTLSFGSKIPGISSTPFRSCGWSPPEPWGSWTSGRTANLLLQTPPAARDLRLTAAVKGRARDGVLEVDVLVNQAKIGRWGLTDQTRDVSAVIPRAVASAARPLRIDFVIPEAAAGPGASEGGAGMGVTRLTVGFD